MPRSGEGAVEGLEGLGEFGGIPSGDPGDVYGGGSQAPVPGPDSIIAGGGGPADTPPVVEAKKPSKTKPVKVAEQKEGVKRKARRRSLLSDEETTVYRRSILGS